MKFNFRFFSLALILTLITFACQDDDPKPKPPEVTTADVTAITKNTAMCGGLVTLSGANQIKERGVCWGTSHDPDISGSHTSDGAYLGPFTSEITGLTPETTYYVRAYVTTDVGTSYGSERSFVSGNEYDVYVAGKIKEGGNWYPAYWKNGEVTILGTVPGVVNAIAVSNGDVYAVGTTDEDAYTINLWKNGEIYWYVTNGSNPAKGEVLKVVDGTIYVGGVETIGGINFAKIWTQGIDKNLTVGSNSSAYVADIQVVQGNIYAAINEGGIGKVIINYTLLHSFNQYLTSYPGTLKIIGSNVYTALTNQTTHTASYATNDFITTIGVTGSSKVSTMDFDGTDMYLAGQSKDLLAPIWVAGYWKNGVLTTLETNDANSAAYSISANTGHVYVTTSKLNQDFGAYVTKLWKDDTPVSPFDGTQAIWAPWLCVVPSN